MPGPSTEKVKTNLTKDFLSSYYIGEVLMLDTKLFEFAKIFLTSPNERYVMATETRLATDVLTYIETTALRVDNIIFDPRTNKIRFMFLPCKANSGMTEVFNTVPTTKFLRRLYSLDVDGLQSAITKYVIQSDLKLQYDGLEETEKTWLSSVILGSKEE